MPHNCRSRPIAIVALTASVLVACSPKPLTGADMPRPRAGLWERIGTMGSETSRGDVCFSGSPLHIPGSAASCQEMTYSKPSDGGWEVDASCGDPKVGSKIRMRYSGDFQSAFTIDGRDVLSIAGQAPHSVDSHNRFRYLGPCPKGRAIDDPQ